MKSKTLIASAVMMALTGSAYAGPDQKAAEHKPSYDTAIEYSKYRDVESRYSLRASDIIGADVRNAANDEIGEVDDLVLSRNDDVIYAVVSVGGFLGLGEKLVAVPYEDLRVDREGDNVYLNMTKEQLESQPEFTYIDGEVFGKRRLTERTMDDHSVWNEIEGNWKQFKGKVQQQWGELTDDQLDRIEGKREELIGLIQEHYGKTEQQAEREVQDWTRTL